MSRYPLPVLTLASIDPVARGAAVASVLCDAPGAIVVQYDVDPVAATTGQVDGATLRRLVLSADGVLEQHAVELDHGCLSCAIREDVLPTLHRLAGWRVEWCDTDDPLILFALPVSAEPLPVVTAIRSVAAQRPGRLRPAAVLTAVDGARFEADLLGDDTLAERGLRLFVDDERAVGEALAHQVEVSDVVAATTPFDARATRLLAHLGTPPLAIATAALNDLRPQRLARHVTPGRDPRGDLQQVRPSRVADGDGVWTVELSSARPLHPGRLLARIEDLGRGRIRARGHVLLASRPHTAVAWDGAGSQLSIGSLGPWATATPSTRIVVTGTETADRARITRAFAGLALTDTEAARGPRWWATQGDDLDPWLGELDGLDDLADLA